VEFVVHDGDFKADPRETRPTASKECADDLFLERLSQFNEVQHPLVFIPGDNEWTDCDQNPDEVTPYDALERLSKLREVFFQGNTSLGARTIPLTRQSENPAYQDFRENVRWTRSGVTFIGVNVTGSNNNLGRNDRYDSEYELRNAADVDWIREGFRRAMSDGSIGVMVVWQANPFETSAGVPDDNPAFKDVVDAVVDGARAFTKPVVLVHGDTHYFRIDLPLTPSGGRSFFSLRTPPLPNLTRVETFGTPNSNWVQVTVDPSDPNVFTFRPRIVG